MELLKRLNIPVAGKHAVVLGRSNIVGVPMALLLLQESATVTVCHSRTENLPDMVRQADIIVAAVGKAQMVSLTAHPDSNSLQTLINAFICSRRLKRIGSSQALLLLTSVLTPLTTPHVLMVIVSLEMWTIKVCTKLLGELLLFLEA